jgi:hypothetical protein
MRTTWPGHHAVAGVDGGLLADGHVLGLRLGDADLGLQLVGAHHLGQQRARRHGLSVLQRQLLQDAVDAGAQLQAVDLLAAELGDRAQPLDLRALGRHLGGDPLRLRGQALLLELEAPGQLVGPPQGLPLLELGEEALLGQLLVGAGPAPGVGEIRADAGHGRLLGQLLRVQASPAG